MKIILHADDFGFTDDTVDATIKCFEEGILSSASIMVNCASSQKAIEYARTHPQFSFGLHLTYVDGLIPAVNPTLLSSLVDDNGKFLGSNEVRKSALFFKLNVNLILLETESQINLLSSGGVAISHLDSHGHLHKFPSFLLALSRLAKGQKQIKVRRVQNVFMQPHTNAYSPKVIVNSILASYIVKNFRTTDYFYMPANSFDTKWANNILRQMDRMPTDSVIEIGVHPGYLESWRKDEYRDIRDFVELLYKQGKHQIVNWNYI